MFPLHLNNFCLSSTFTQAIMHNCKHAKHLGQHTGKHAATQRLVTTTPNSALTPDDAGTQALDRTPPIHTSPATAASTSRNLTSPLI